MGSRVYREHRKYRGSRGVGVGRVWSVGVGCAGVGE